VFGQLAPYLGSALGWPQVSVVVRVTRVDGTVHVVQEYAGGQLAVLGLQLPAVVGVQSSSVPPRYVSMARLRQAMTEASTESLIVSVETSPPASTIVSISRPEQTAGATMLDGGPEQIATQIAALLREQGALVS
jgi:electron transfer flavoprotein alpha/beta subunit